jgi:hypothetical protein
VNTTINSAFVPVPVKLLIDVETVMRFGFSRCFIPTNNFDDYLGKGFSGVIGKRARIEVF